MVTSILPPQIREEEPVFQPRSMWLCKRCVDAFRRGRYFVKRIDVCTPTRIRSCDYCHSRTFAGWFEIGEQHEPVDHTNWRVRQNQSIIRATEDTDKQSKDNEERTDLH